MAGNGFGVTGEHPVRDDSPRARLRIGPAAETRSILGIATAAAGV